MKPTLVIYHKDCPDGFAAAWAAWRKFGSRAEYIGMEPRGVPKVPFRNRTVYVVDNSFGKKDVKRIERVARRLVVIDHHESSASDVRSAKEHVFDLAHSGAVLAWRYFHPGAPMPRLLNYVEDVDLWRFKLPNVHAITNAVYMEPFMFAKWSRIARALETAKGRATFIMKGNVVRAYKDELVMKVIEKAEPVRFAGYTVLAVNSSLKQLTSNVGHELCLRKQPFGIVWYVERGELHVSLRAEDKVDTSKIAAKYGGGGHPNSSGFSAPFTGKFPWRPV